jgi:hypothetical protein
MPSEAEVARALALKVMFSGPWYQVRRPTMGGCSMSVILGPGAEAVQGFTRPPRNTPPCIIGLRAEVSEADWKSGHLLNASFGGANANRNLTPLTRKANARHRGLVEAPVERTLMHINRFHAERAWREDPSLSSYRVYALDYRVVTSQNNLRVVIDGHARTVLAPESISCTAVYCATRDGRTFVPLRWPEDELFMRWIRRRHKPIPVAAGLHQVIENIF